MAPSTRSTITKERETPKKSDTSMLLNPRDKSTDIIANLEASKENAKKELKFDRPKWTKDHVPIERENEAKQPTEAELKKFPLFSKLEMDTHGKLVLPTKKNGEPDTNVLLSDEIVYLAMKEWTQEKRKAYKGVWDANGEIRTTRIPQDPAPQIDMHGLHCAAIWKRYYALVGLQAAAKYGFLVKPKADKNLKASAGFSIGPIVFGDEFAGPFQAADDLPARTIIRQSEDHKGRYSKRIGNEEAKKILDIVGDDHHHISAKFTGSEPELGRLCDFPGWSASCSPNRGAFCFPPSKLVKWGLASTDTVRSRKRNRHGFVEKIGEWDDEPMTPSAYDQSDNAGFGFEETPLQAKRPKTEQSATPRPKYQPKPRSPFKQQTQQPKSQAEDRDSMLRSLMPNTYGRIANALDEAEKAKAKLEALCVDAENHQQLLLRELQTANDMADDITRAQGNFDSFKILAEDEMQDTKNMEPLIKEMLTQRFSKLFSNPVPTKAVMERYKNFFKTSEAATHDPEASKAGLEGTVYDPKTSLERPRSSFEASTDVLSRIDIAKCIQDQNEHVVNEQAAILESFHAPTPRVASSDTEPPSLPHGAPAQTLKAMTTSAAGVQESSDNKSQLKQSTSNDKSQPKQPAPRPDEASTFFADAIHTETVQPQEGQHSADTGDESTRLQAEKV
ncbi:hypothetical protein PENDEC_c014G04017 [Penicillium decumbens]|uniref:Uncharacterized protein n=1 Tax=Penicillium decumbens TaxID=69771 RepID=A0A1V6PA38_PENDC|nr:hypothetical protein PENDEC_c014G04017 [Penicillium decumbens]